MKKILFGIILVTFFNLVSFAQQTAFAVKTDNGIAVFYNNGKNSFAFEIFGKDIKPQTFNPNIMLFLVDGKVVQVNFPTLKAVLGGKLIKDENAILKAHQKWELDFQSEQVFKQKLKIESEDSIFLNLTKGESKETFFWSYQRPASEKDSQFVGDAFQATVVGDRVMVIGSPLTPNQDITERRRYFNGTLSTIVFFDKEIKPNTPQTAPAKPKVKAKVKSKK